MSEIIQDDYGILLESYMALPEDQRPVVYYQEGDHYSSVVVSVSVNEIASEYADLQLANDSVSCLIEGTWLDFLPDYDEVEEE